MRPSTLTICGSRFALSFLIKAIEFLKYSVWLWRKSCANMMSFEQIGINPVQPEKCLKLMFFHSMTESSLTWMFAHHSILDVGRLMLDVHLFHLP